MAAADPAVTLVEVAPRDGLQNEAVHLSVAQKRELVADAVAAGARRIEAVSFANPARVPAMAGAEELMAEVPREPGLRYAGLVMNDRGLDRALACGVDEINIVAVVTDTFSMRNQNTDTAGALALVSRLVPRAREAGIPVSVTLGASFGCPFEGEVGLDRLRDCVSAVADAGPAEIALADTIGVAVPRDVHERIALARAAAPGTTLRVHLHDTRNTGVANALAAVDAGVTVLDSSIGGAGGCPFAPAATGNVATEDLVYALRRSGIDTGHDLERLREGAARLQTALQRTLPSALLAAGDFPDRSRSTG